MSTTVFLDLKAKPESLAELKAFLRQILPATRDYAGCLGVDVLANLDDPNELVLHQRWESRQHYETYLAWRVDTGVVATLTDHTQLPPNIRYFETLEA